MFKKLLKCLAVATVITPAAVAPAVAGCCGAFAVVNGSATITQGIEGSGLTTTDTVTNTSMQMTVTETAQFTAPSTAPGGNGTAADSPGACSEDVM